MIEQPKPCKQLTMPTSTKDPRKYIKAQPLPIPTQKGIRIQARSDLVYNPTLPTRSEVRKHHYERRQEQKSCQGFNSVPHLKYKGIGDPFYLDQKKMILYALGQWNEDMKSSSSDEGEDVDDALKTMTVHKSTPTKFVLRRKRKDLNNLNRSLAHGRKMIRNVRLGHSLFHMADREAMAKEEEKEAEAKLKLERLRTECQPPKMDTSSEDETDEEIEKDVDLRHNEAMNELPTSAKSRRGTTPRSKKKQPAARPYTPQHANIAVDPSDPAHKLVVFRQLCALYWLLESMTLEPPLLMGTISTCWNFRNIGGTRTSEDEQQRMKTKDRDWNKFISNRSHTKVNVFKRLMAPRSSRTPRRTSSANQRTMSISSSSDYPVRLNQSSSAATVSRMDSAIREEDENSVQQEGTTTTVTEDDDDYALNKGLFSFLDEYYESLRREREAQEAKDEQASSPEPVRDSSLVGYRQSQQWDHRPSTAPLSHRKSLLMSTADVQNAGRRLTIDSKGRPATSRGRLDSVRPKSALEEFQSTLSSDRFKSMPTEMRQKFSEVQEEQAIYVHDAIEVMERQRLKVLHSKFRHMPTGGAFHRAVRQMRIHSMREDEDPNKKNTSTHQEWYSFILENIPLEMQRDWYVDKILKKISKFGSVDSVKQNEIRFLKVLKGLRSWEICNPDISAAIEFCREKIIEYPVENYEEWFAQSFPSIVRPQTAPPAVNKENRKESERLMYKVPSSAPARTR